MRVPDYWFDSRFYYFAKNYGRLYALATTGAHVKGALLNRLRCALSRRPHGEKPGFLSTLVTHDLRAAFGPAPRAHIPTLAKA